MPEITSIYAALLALLFLALSLRVVRFRREHRLSLGDAGNTSLLKRMRAQANCAEYTPIGLLLLLLVEMQGAPAILVHLLGLALLVGRILHAYGFSTSPPKMALRIAGMVLTFAMIAISAFTLLGLALV